MKRLYLPVLMGAAAVLYGNGNGDVLRANGFDNKDSNERYEGFKLAMNEAGLEPDKDLVIHGNFQIPIAKNVLGKLITQENKIPGRDFQAVIAANDYMAFGAMEKLKEYDIMIPDQVAVSGFDNVDIARYIEPPLTTVSLSFFKMGEDAAIMLFNKIDGKKPDEIHKTKCEPVYLESCGCSAVKNVYADVTHEISTTGNSDNKTAQKELLPELLLNYTNTFEADSRTILNTWSHAISMVQNPDYWSDKKFIRKDAPLKEQLWPVILSTAKRSIRNFWNQELFSTLKTKISMTHDIAEIMDHLYFYLPKLGIKECYICIYSNPAKTCTTWKLPSSAILFLAYNSVLF